MKINVVNGDMWQAVYIDEELIYENHQVDLNYLFQVMKTKNPNENIKNIEFNEEYCDIDWLEDVGNFPKDYKEIQF